MPASFGGNGRVFVNGYNISGFLNSFSLDTSLDTSEISSFLSAAKEYLAGQSDGTSSGEGIWDGDTGEIDAILSEIKRDEAIYSYYPGGVTNGAIGYSFRALRSSYNTQNTIDDAVRFSLASQVSKGTNRVKSIGGTAIKTTTGSTTVLDLGVSGGSEKGAVIYFHATAITGTAVVVVEHSPDNTDWDTLTALSNVSAAGAQRLEVEGDVDRYVRVTVTLDAEESITFQAGICVK